MQRDIQPARPYEVLRKWTRRPSVRWYLVVASAMTVAAGAMPWLVVPPTGLIRTFYLRSGPDVLQFPPERTSDITLAFLEDDPALPSRFFGVEWAGYWYVPRDQTVVLLAGADDRVDILSRRPACAPTESRGGHAHDRGTSQPACGCTPDPHPIRAGPR